MIAPVLRLERITKSFGGTRALTDAKLDLYAGQATALLGENGAGKSTLVKLLTGVHQPDSGEIRIDDRAVRIDSPQAAQRLGVSVIHQESVVFDDLSVAENIFVADLPIRRGVLDWRSMRKRTATLLLQLESTIDPRSPLNKLSIAEKHLVQIARALSHEARIVIMDEPTAALSKKEADDLLRIVARLRSEGRAVLFISHKFEEVFAIADRYAVFRDGATVGEGLIAETNVDELIQRMAGRAITHVFPKTTAVIGREVLRVEHLCREPEYSNVSFCVRAGEVLGVYGLVGAGRSNVMRTIFGLGNADSGEILISGLKGAPKHPEAAIRAGIAYVPEDRQGQGAILSHTIADNIVLPSLRLFAECGLINAFKLEAAANEWTKRLKVKCASASQLAHELSGGNQQKVVLAKWLMTKPKLLILDEPTKGIDVGAKAAVHQLIRELAEQGIAVVLVSSELPEVLGMADRILVMRRGRIRGDFVRSEVNAQDVLRAAAA